jgi:hypothetical protein
MLISILLIGIILFATAYRFYGRFLDENFGIDPDNTTPAIGRPISSRKRAMILGAACFTREFLFLCLCSVRGYGITE